MTHAGRGPLLVRVCVAFVLLAGGATSPAAATGHPADAPTVSSQHTSHPAQAATAPRAAPSAGEGAIGGALTSIRPSIASPGQDVIVRLVITNPSDSAVGTAQLGLRLGGRLRTRADVAAHAATPSRQGPVVVSTTISDLTAKESRPVTVRLPASRIPLQGPFGVLPLTIDIAAGEATHAIATFVPYQVRKEYEPLRLAVALPLTMAPDPRMLTGSTAQTQAAWAEATGANSPAMHAVQGARGSAVTWLLDPAMTGPAPGAAATAATALPQPPPATSASSASAAAAPSNALVAAMRGRSNQGLWLLPRHDPDLSALAATKTTLSRILDEAAGPKGTTTPLEGTPPVVGWLAGSAGESTRRTVAGAFPGQDEVTLLVPESRSDPDPRVTGDAVRTDSGRRVLAVDDSLSSLFSRTSNPQAAASLAQHALADTVALLQESPGRPRTVLVLPARGFNPSPPALQTLLSTLRSAPWVSDTPAQRMLDRSAAAGRAPAVDDSASPPPVTPSPLTPSSVQGVRQLSARANGIAGVLEQPIVPHGALLDMLTSAAWRGHAPAWRGVRDQLRERLDTLTEGVTVVPSTVNFFAETGALQVTVVNDLNVEVHDVRLVTEVQGRPPRLRIRSDPGPLRIRPKSRTTVRLDVEAVAAGVVPIRTYLKTPSGTSLGDVSTVRVRVQPTNGWLVLGAGIVVGLVFIAGLFRAIRAGERRVDKAELRGSGSAAGEHGKHGNGR